MPDQLGAAVLGHEAAGVIDDQLAASPLIMTPGGFERFEDGGLLDGQAGEPVAAAAVAEGEGVDVKLGLRPAEADGVFGPIELGLLAGGGFEALRGRRGSRFGLDLFQQSVEASWGAGIAVVGARFIEDATAFEAAPQAAAEEFRQLGFAGYRRRSAVFGSRRRGERAVDGVA